MYPNIKRRRGPHPRRRPPETIRTLEAEEELTPIRGKEPGSREEWRVAQALYRLNVEFLYQVPIQSLTGVAGAYIIDFVVFTPFRYPLEVLGAYWHKMKAGDRLRLAQIRAVYGREPIIIWDWEIPDLETAYQVVRERLKMQ